jgi:phage baseplate assembly protein W
MAIDVYGRGASFPLNLGSSGGIGESSGPDKIEQSIRVILNTQAGERVMRPTFGANLKSLVFAPNNAATAGLARQYVSDALRQWEPRIEVTQITVENQQLQGALIITIRYIIRATQDVRSMIYPFYLEKR